MSEAQLNNLVRLLGAGGPRDPGAPIEAVRSSFEKLGRLLGPPAGSQVEVREVAGVACERIRPPAGSSPGEIVYLHGGGYVSGSPATHRGLVARLAAASGFDVWSVDYRLAPEHPHPAALEDSLAVVEARVERREDGAVALVGDSAGGGLVLAVLSELSARRGAFRVSERRLPAAGVCLSPWTDLEATGASVSENASSDPLVSPEGLRRMADLYLAGADPRLPVVSPLHADLRGLPPMLVLVGSTEVLRDDATRVARVLERDGVDVTLEVWERMIHVWPLYARLLDEGQQAIERVAGFVREALAERVGSGRLGG